MLQAGVLESVPVDAIELDKGNPRISRYIEMYTDPSDDALFQALGAGSDDPEAGSTTTFEKLRQSIITNHGVIQPVILNRVSDGRLVCIEGNTRVAIYKDFVAQGRDGDWRTIPALVHENLDEAGIDAIRLQVHLVPPRGWDPYSKARYLHNLRNVQHLPFSVIVDYAGGRTKEIQDSLAAYDDMEQYYRPIVPDDSFDARKYSGFLELQKPGIKESIYKAGYSLKDFAQWIYDERLYPLVKVRILPNILRHEEARKVFLKDGARKAETYLDKPDISKAVLDAPLLQIARTLSSKINKMQYDELKQLKSDVSGEVVQELTLAYETLRDLLTDLDLSPGVG